MGDDNDKDMCDDVVDWKQGALTHARGFSFGGSPHSKRDAPPPRLTEPIVVIADDDEVCVFASEGELFCWRFEGMPKGATPAKNKGSARHVAGVATEVGNGRISMDHGGTEGSPSDDGGLIEMVDMKSYIKAKHAGENPIIPRHADVQMKPGKNGEGWWAGLEKREQVELIGDIFNVVYNTDLDLAGALSRCHVGAAAVAAAAAAAAAAATIRLPYVFAGNVHCDDLQAALEETRKAHPGVRGGLPYVLALQLDRSNNHLAKYPTALNAKTMRKGRGFAKAAHQRSTHWPRAVVDFRCDNCLADGTCVECQMSCARAVADGTQKTLQTIGRKGLVQVLAERGVVTRGKSGPELAEILGAHADFAAEKSAVQHILVNAGHIGFFGAVCHPELAFIEMKWAHVKQYLRPLVDDKDETLYRLLKEAFSIDACNVDAMRKGARHCRDTMHAYRYLRSQGSLVSPEEVAANAGIQKRHRQPYASLMAGLIVAAEVPVANLARLQKAVATQKVRTNQGAEREKRKQADKAKNYQIDRRKKYRREKVTVEFVQKVAAEKAARAAAKAAKAAQAQAPTPDVIVLD